MELLLIGLPGLAFWLSLKNAMLGRPDGRQTEFAGFNGGSVVASSTACFALPLM
jgi:hypothetical protein